MPRRPIITLVTASAAALVALPLVAGHAGADAGTTTTATTTSVAAAPAAPCGVSIGPNLAVVSGQGSFSAALTAPCTAAGVDHAAWDLVPRGGGKTIPLVFSATTRSAAAYASKDVALGTYDVKPRVAIDNDACRYVDQTSAVVTVKLQSRAGVTLKRSGSKVMISTRPEYFEPGSARWQGWKNARVAVQKQGADGVFRTVRTVNADADGRLHYVVESKDKATWRVAVQPTSRIWERLSTSVRG